jgi:hypothetical protein
MAARSSERVAIESRTRRQHLRRDRANGHPPMRTPTNRRWLRFSLRMLFLVFTVLCVWLGYRANVVRQRMERFPLEGSWNGTDGRRPCSAVFTGDTVVMQYEAPGSRRRMARFATEIRNGLIDLKSHDGVCLGRYALAGDTLTIKLGQSNRPRPYDLAPSSSFSRGQQYVFTRGVPRKPVQQASRPIR